METIHNLEDIDNTCIKSLGEGLTSSNRNGHLIIFKLETNISNVPEVIRYLGGSDRGKTRSLPANPCEIPSSHTSGKGQKNRIKFWMKLITLSIMSDHCIHTI